MSLQAVLLQQLTNAVMLGTIYGLIAIGFSLFFGTLDIIQFAHGDVYMLGGFAALTVAAALTSAAASAPALAVPLVFVAGAALTALAGVAFGRLAVRPLLGSPPLITLLATLAGGIALREAVRLFYPNGTAAQRFPSLFPAGSVELGGVLIRYDNFFILAIGLGVFAATALLVNRTRLGRAIRAISQDREAAAMMGVDLDRTLDLCFVLGSALAGVAGALYGAYYNQVIFTMGLTGGLIGFSAATIGGLGHILGAVVGGYLFALLQTLASALLPGGSEYRDVFAFLVVILFLMFRPTGILGERQAERV
ncbi:MAG TPA: branched-chain amino acid ABC transporter permease [Limnochordales bacterium]